MNNAANNFIIQKPIITFITRHYPPNPNINGESVWDMVKYLHDKFNVQSNVICIDRDSDGGGNRRASEGNVISIKTFYEGKNSVLRFFSFLYDGFMLIKKALQYKDTLIVCTTSPPMLPFWASVMFSKKVTWALWLFDIFPEGLAVGNFISDKNPFYKFIVKQTYKNPPSLLIALGPKQYNFITEKYKQKIPVVILPCGVFFYQDKSEQTPFWWQKDKIIFGYCGNIAEGHNPEFVKTFIDNINPEIHHLILAPYGRHAELIKNYAKAKPGVTIVETVPRDQLHFIDVHLVSLRSNWTHIAVPSKAVSAVSLGATILFCGSIESDNWYLLQNAGWLIDENEDLEQSVKKVLPQITRYEIEQKKAQAILINSELKQYVLSTYNQINNILQKDFNRYSASI
jgi:hypothetical protein